MPAWEIKAFGGVIPLLDPRLTGDNMAERVLNADMTTGQLHGLFAPVLVHDFTAVVGPVERAYYFPGPNDPIWVPFPSKYSCIARSPLANDDNYRLYWTNPGDLSPHWNTHARLKAGNPAYDLGTVQPTGALTVGTPVGGDTTVPQITRSYLYTWVNQYGEESAPSPASNTMDGPPDATWPVSGLPTAAPANPAGRNYPAITALVLYRTVTGVDTGTQFLEVQRWNYPPGPPASFNDTIPDLDIAGNLALPSLFWNNPPDHLDGLIAYPGGMLVGFTGNTIHFSEPDRPHTWPTLYDQSVHYDVVTLAVWQQYLMVMTQGFPSTGAGKNPSVFTLVQTQVSEPCISRGSVITDLTGTYYASQNGLVQLSGLGMQPQTQGMIDKERWLEDYHARDLVACRHRSQYLAIMLGTGNGFIIDYAESRLGFQTITVFKDAVCVWNDEYFGDTYICANKKIYRWDDPSQLRVPYLWRSKRFFAPVPISLGAVQVTLGAEVITPPDAAAQHPPLDNGCPDLPSGVNAIFRYYAGPDFKLIMERYLVSQQELFRLPKGFRAFDHQVEVVAMVPIYSIQIGTTYSELRGV